MVGSATASASSSSGAAVRLARMGPGRVPFRWRKRPDVPRLKPRRLGVRERVIEIAGSRGSLSKAVKELNEDMFATTTKKTK
eukprot:14286278-Heterocapsa_arctica.AAC.1